MVKENGSIVFVENLVDTGDRNYLTEMFDQRDKILSLSYIITGQETNFKKGYASFSWRKE